MEHFDSSEWSFPFILKDFFVTKRAENSEVAFAKYLCSVWDKQLCENWDTRADFFAKLEVMKWLVFEVLEDQHRVRSTGGMSELKHFEREDGMRQLK